MKAKYANYMHLVKRDKVEEEYEVREYKEVIKKEKEFISKEVIDILFPGHIKSYYVSAEF